MPGPQNAGAAPVPSTALAVTTGGFALKNQESTQHTLTGTSPDGGRTMMIRTLGGGPGAQPLPPMFADGQVQFEVHFTTVLDEYAFHYRLAADPRPVRTATVSVPRPPAKAKP